MQLNAAKNPASFSRMILVRFIVSQSFSFSVPPPLPPPLVRSNGEFEGLSPPQHNMTSLPRKLLCLACTRLHCATPFVFSHQIPFLFRRPNDLCIGNGRKSVSPGFTISVRRRGHTIPLSPAPRHQTHAPLLQLESTAYSRPSETGDYASESTHPFRVVWNRFLSLALWDLKITYHYRDALHHSSRSSEGDNNKNYDTANQTSGERSTIFRMFSPAERGTRSVGRATKTKSQSGRGLP